MARSHDDKPPSIMEPLVAGLGIALVLGVLTWLSSSNRIVWASLNPSLWAGSMWKWVPSDFTYARWNYVVGAVATFAPRPWEVSFVSWVSMVTTAFQPLMAILIAAYLMCLPWVVRNHQRFSRRFNADKLVREISSYYTGVLPVLAIRKLVAKNSHPLWRKQVTPEEVFLNYRVPQEVQGWAATGTPMVRDGKFDRDVARTYFTAFEKRGSGRPLVSGMLGRQLVDLVVDARAGSGTVFADRASAEGKTLLALWSAAAFGGQAGKDEFCKFRDALNRSAYGTKDGKANLALAQPLYDKWRTHKDLNKILAVHHWEHTALFFLLSLAQKKGRYTTAEVLWLRPTNRVMFTAMNTRGSYTPHTEAAATFAQFAFEQACAKMGRVPLMRDEQPGANGALIPSVFVERAVDALALERARWEDAIDEDEDWWRGTDIWKTANAAVNQACEIATRAVPAAAMPGASADTAFDRMSAAAAVDAEQRANRALQAEMTAAFGASAADMGALMAADPGGGKVADF